MGCALRLGARSAASLHPSDVRHPARQRTDERAAGPSLACITELTPQYRSGVNLPDGRVGAPSFDDKTSSMPTFDVMPRYYPHQNVCMPPAPAAAPAPIVAPPAPAREPMPEPEAVPIDEEYNDEHVRAIGARFALNSQGPFAPYGALWTHHMPGLS